MPKELFLSSYECDCGHQSHFFERTIRQIKAMSFKREQYLLDSEREEHTIVFHQGKMIDVLCPEEKTTRQLQRRKRRTNSQGRKAIS